MLQRLLMNIFQLFVLIYNNQILLLMLTPILMQNLLLLTGWMMLKLQPKLQKDGSR